MSDLEEEYRLSYFEDRGFVRRECTECGAHFWTLDDDRETCGEPPCDAYSFIDDPGFDESFELNEMRERFLAFFEERDHDRIDPYPVAANRWRDDVLLTQASIYDFQPLVTSGETPPPANPLTISQPCIRMQDIDNVGVTGRHTMAFEMMAHHAFNAREEVGEQYAYSGEVYWKEDTVRYCVELLEELGADMDEVTLIEDPWVGGGNAGPAFEVIYQGAELATLVFMQFEQDPDGDVEMKDGNSYSPMDTYVVDTGYGLERWTWMSQGTPTVYEAIYPDAIATIRDAAAIEMSDDEERIVHRAAALAGEMDIDEAEDIEAARADIAAEIGVDVERLRDLLEPLEAAYAIADHCRTLAYMFGDGIVPSNVGTGYLARMVLRRTVRLADEIDLAADLDDLVAQQARRLGYSDRETIREMVTSEVGKYRETLDRGGRRVRQIAEEYADRDEPIPAGELIELYDSHGIQPDTVEAIAAELDVAVDVPEDFYARVADRHEQATADRQESGLPYADRLGELPDTDRLYYEDQQRLEFEAVVLEVFEHEDDADEDRFDVVLDQTRFYPEGGGQPADHGTLATDDRTVSVTDVQIQDGVVVHTCDADPGTGEFVRGQVERDRREALMAHHTATHAIIHAARDVLGEHVRQAGAQKGVESSRIDLRHYEAVDADDRRAIEHRANEIVRENAIVEINWVDRHAAEDEHGFDLYQGGIPAGEEIRTVQVCEDVQACGGTHVARTGDVGAIVIRSTERVQDGVVRVTFSAGRAAIDAHQDADRALRDAADTFDVAPESVPETAERFFEEWKQRGKEIDRLKEDLATARASGGSEGDIVEVGDERAVVRRMDADMDALRATANAIVDDGDVAVVGSGADGAQFVVARPEGSAIDAGSVVGALADRVGGGGGGPPAFAQGGGPDADALDDALDSVPDILDEQIAAQSPD
ncbi:alanine--tRNA ligase [Halococcoides cellulosivorans]|uniref:Alanine--tRNA ligase n=1 Tax=Halococcoides cellulosivorans TaxID=1679096 RepID=A0A2R4WXG9_9EURY|nr:alanine--tRNA ligase [Halococcoides cellulosivorans]AWB26228.1 alanine--tRNA ligase [Halococcoides cellulosivorans]